MAHHALRHRFAAVPTATLADASIRARVPVRCAPALLRAVVPGSCLAGRVCPARHAGSVDAFLEAFETAEPGDVLVVDNGGGLDAACAGDLVAPGGPAGRLGRIMVWGVHPDTDAMPASRVPGFRRAVTPPRPPGL